MSRLKENNDCKKQKHEKITFILKIHKMGDGGEPKTYHKEQFFKQL